jgi:DNA-binding response OmpR family regulator
VNPDIFFQGGGMPQTILSVDGNAACCSDRNDLLRAAGFEIPVADTGTDTLKLALEHRPTLIVVVIELSGTDGFSICRQLKADPRTAITRAPSFTSREWIGL